MGADDSTLIMGTCDGTGVAINVCLGFIPSRVEVFNTEDAGTLYPVIDWIREFQMTSALDEGVKETGTTDSDRAVVAANGIAEYAGGDEMVYSSTNSRWEDSAAASVEEVYVDGFYTKKNASNPAYRCIGDSIAGKPAYDADNVLLGGVNPYDGARVKAPEGFTIGIDGDMNVNGEQLVWVAHR